MTMTNRRSLDRRQFGKFLGLAGAAGAARDDRSARARAGKGRLEGLGQ